MAAPYTAQFADGTPYPMWTQPTTSVPVANNAALAGAISSLSAGQKLVLASGSYSALTVTGKAGTSTAGIGIEAAAGATVTFTGKALIDDCAYITLKGLSFPTDPEGDLVQFRGTSNHFKLHRCTIGPASHPGSATTGEAGTYVFVGDDCHHFQFAYNELRNKSRAGNGFRVYGNFDTSKMAQYGVIDHNIVRDFYPAVVNDFEPFRIGVSSMSLSDSFIHVERNYVFGIKSEPEVISIKSGKCRVYGNTIEKSAGGPVIRHGIATKMTDNYIIDGASTTNTNNEGSGGPRFYDADHEVAYNLMQGLSGTSYQAALQLDGGESGTSLSRHAAVVRANVHHNIIVECATPITVKAHYSIAPASSKVEDNLVAAAGTAAVQYLGGSTASGTGSVQRNDWYASATAAGLVKNSQGVYTKANLGPRVRMLTRADVGPAGDLNETDGVGDGPITDPGGGGGGTPPQTVPFTAQVFVSPSGSDTNSGLSASTPKKTLAAALSVAAAGQTIAALDGAYDGNFLTTKGGSAAAGKVTLRAATKYGATINGNGSTVNQAAVEIVHPYLRVEDFEITGTSGSGLRHGVLVNADHVDIVGCKLHNICQFLTAGTTREGGAGVLVSGSPRTNVLIDRNLIFNVGLSSSTQQLVHGIYCTAPVTDGRVTNNVIYECEDVGVHALETTASGWRVINNTIADCGRGILQAADGITRNNIVHNATGRHYDIRGAGNLGSNNFYSGTGTGITGATFAASIGDPGFVNAASRNYKLTSSSGLRDTGTNVDAPTVDHDGATRPA